MSVSAVEHVRKALAARQYDGGDPVDLSDECEIAEGVELPQMMMSPDAGLLYWCGFGSVSFESEVRRRYVADATVNVVITAPREGDERAAEVAGRVVKWFVGALAVAPASPSGLIHVQPDTLTLVGEQHTDRAGRPVLTGTVAASYEVSW